MAPDKIPWLTGLSFLGLMSRMKNVNGDDENPVVDWRVIGGIAGAVISLLLVVVGFLISAGLNNNQATLGKIESKQMEVIKNQFDMKTDFVIGIGSIKTEVARIEQKVNDHIDQTRRLHPEAAK